LYHDHCGTDAEITVVVVRVIDVAVHLTLVHVPNLHVAVCPSLTYILGQALVSENNQSIQSDITGSGTFL
jgi:hypothetical protein